jgi:hypothetical protein
VRIGIGGGRGHGTTASGGTMRLKKCGDALLADYPISRKALTDDTRFQKNLRQS